jgi:uncharacterized protein YjbI with pentapeptide repeats
MHKATQQHTEQNNEEGRRPWWVQVWHWVCKRWKQLHLDIWWPALALAVATLFAIAYPNEPWFLQAEPPGQTEVMTYGDVAELLIVPLTLAVVAYAFSSYQRREDREIAADHRQQDLVIAEQERENDREIARNRNEEAELQTYFDRMSELMLTHKLHPQPERDENEGIDTTYNETASTIARARTLAVLRSIKDPVRKGSVVRFLYESGLIQGEENALVKLHEADLQGANLEKIRLTNANLEGTNLQGANLRRSLLNKAILAWAHLEGAELIGTDLHKAHLQGVRLQGANLCGAHLDNASLGRASLQGAYLQGAYLHKADLTEANLERAHLEEANLREVQLDKSILREVHLQGADLIGADLYGTNMEKADLYRARLHKAHLLVAYLREANLRGTSLEGACLEGACLEGACLEGACLEGANLQGVETDEYTNFEGARYNNKTTPPPGGFPNSAINVDEQDEPQSDEQHSTKNPVNLPDDDTPQQ